MEERKIKDFSKDEYDEFISLFSVSNGWHLIRKMLSTVGSDFLDDGERVAFIAMNLAKQEELDSQNQRRLIYAALFHDIGRIWESSSDQHDSFDFNSKYERALSSYLFLKYFSPLKEYSEIVLFQHGREDRKQKNAYYPLGVTLHLCEDVDELNKDGRKKDEIIEYIRDHAGILYNAKDVEAMAVLLNESNVLSQLNTSSCHEAVDDFLSSLYFRRDVIRRYLYMVTYCIEFYNKETMYHARISAFVCYALGRYLDFSLHDLCVTYTAGLFGDIGKVMIPHSILEKPGKLSEEEEKTMRKHIDYTKTILEGCFKDREVIDVAYAHHERLDGSGYPCHKKGNELNRKQRVAAIADVTAALLSSRTYKEAYPLDKTIDELMKMKDEGKLDGEIVDVLIANKDEIIAYLKRHLNKMMRSLAELNAEKIRLKYANIWEK